METCRPYTVKLLTQYQFPPFPSIPCNTDEAEELFVLDRIFAPETAYLVKDLAGRLAARYQALASERDTLRRELDASIDADASAIAEREHLGRAYNELTMTHDEIARACKSLAAENDSLVRVRDDLLAEREVLARSRDAIAAEREALIQSHGELAAERQALIRSRDERAAQREELASLLAQTADDRNAILTSRSWRLTRPLRTINAWLGKRER